MKKPISQSGVRYSAEIEHVQEVTLLGTADRDFWAARLQPYGLRIGAPGGAAQVMVSASALRWRGFRFRELIVSIATCAEESASGADSFFLAQGFSSSRLLAWAERRFFETPYDCAETRLELGSPCIETQLGGRSLFRAQMGQPRAASRDDAAWSGRVFLPAARGPAARATRRFFYVDIRGEQMIYPFAASTDTLAIAPDARAPVFEWLVASHFTPTEWRIRADATHARSQSYTG